MAARQADFREDCVFCEIALGRRFARVVHETDNLLCFFPLEPNLLGHTLITTRRHFEHLGDCPPELGLSVFEACQKISLHYSAVIGATGFNLLNASGKDADQSVPHLHFHYMPRRPNDGLDTWPVLAPFETDLDELVRLLRVPL
jgi:histidine triad (HIT) family protein